LFFVLLVEYIHIMQRLGLASSAFDGDQIVAYSLRSRAIKRKTDRDQQAHSYTSRRRCSEYQMSLLLLLG